MTDLYLFRNALKDLLRPGRVITAILLIALPALVALGIRLNVRELNADQAYGQLVQYVIYGFIMVILSVVFSTGVISQEIEQKTIVYLLTRPLPRWRIALMKFLAAVLVTIVTVCLALLLTALVIYGPGGMAHSALGRDLAIAPLGVLAYSALFLLLAASFRYALIIGLAFAYGWEALVTVLQGNFQRLSLMAHLQTLAPHIQVPPETVDLRDALNPPTVDVIPPALSWGVLIGVTVVCLAAALIVFSVNEYAPREDAA